MDAGIAGMPRGYLATRTLEGSLSSDHMILWYFVNVSIVLESRLDSGFCAFKAITSSCTVFNQLRATSTWSDVISGVKNDQITRSEACGTCPLICSFCFSGRYSPFQRIFDPPIGPRAYP